MRRLAQKSLVSSRAVVLLLQRNQAAAWAQPRAFVLSFLAHASVLLACLVSSRAVLLMLQKQAAAWAQPRAFVLSFLACWCCRVSSRAVVLLMLRKEAAAWAQQLQVALA